QIGTPWKAKALVAVRKRLAGAGPTGTPALITRNQLRAPPDDSHGSRASRPLFDRLPLRRFEHLAAESAALPCGLDGEHAEVTVAAGLLQANTGSQETVQFVEQDDVAWRGDRFEHAVDVDPLAAEEIGLGRPSGFAAVAANG